VNILTIIQRYHPVIGGSEILTKRFMDYLSKKHKVTVFTTTAEDIQAFWNSDTAKITEDSATNYIIKRYDFLTPSEIKFDKNSLTIPLINNYPGPFSPKLWNDLVLKKIDYDLIYVTSFPYDHIIPAYIAAKKWKIPIIITPLIHQEFPELYLTSMRLTILNNSDAIFVLSKSEKKILVEHGIDENKISLIHPIIDESSTKTANPEDFREKLSLSSEDKIILFVGSKSFVKGILNLIEAMKMVWKSKKEPVLILIGPSTEEFDNYFSKLPKNIQKKIRDLGPVDDEIKKNALSSCDIVVLPSKSESFGLVYLEAWSFSKPVIGCNIVPVSEIIVQNKNGILVEFGNVTELCNAINSLIDNPALCKKFGNEGKKKFLSYNSQDTLKDFEQKCKSVIESFKNMKHL